MPHGLERRHPLNACGANPLTVTLRYRCECAGNEVIAISVILDRDCSKEQFSFTMEMLYRDIMFEVQQHLNPPETTPNASSGDQRR
jgi:hypothetical protein